MHLWLPGNYFIIKTAKFWHFEIDYIVFMKIIGHIRHFQWLGPNVWREISQIWIENTKPIYQFICQQLSLPLYNAHPTWLSLTDEPNFDDYHYQFNSLSLVSLLLLIIKFSFICEEQSCRVRITSHCLNQCWQRFLMPQKKRKKRGRIPGLILVLHPANERRRYKVTPSLIG